MLIYIISFFAVLEALEMEAMMSDVLSWITQHKGTEQAQTSQGKCEKSVHFLIIEGFLLYHYKYVSFTD